MKIIHSSFTMVYSCVHKINMKFSAFSMLVFFAININAQSNYWQQKVDYKMDINFDVKTHQFTGEQTLVYTNNSPDTLYRAFWHLYFNAFQPNSMMDVRNRTIKDPSEKIKSRIVKLSNQEMGYHTINSLTQDGDSLDYTIEGTVLEVNLNEPLLPSNSTTFQMVFDSQVPIQIRRSGRNNTEGVDYSMAQWFPKLAEYDEMGWHSHPYVGREFYAPWGSYDVSITIDKKYTIGATGTLQSPNEIGKGYEEEGVKVKTPKGKTLTWNFKADNVHDFVWAADPDYTHTTRVMDDGLVLHFFFIDGKDTENWEFLPEMTEKAFNYIEANFGEYPFPQYSIIQGGDGGMEYPMATLITGERSLISLVGVTVHEGIHSWYQGLLGTNESYFSWMDEGFTTYATAETMATLFPDSNNSRTQENNYNAYINGASYVGDAFKEEPLSTHADHFVSNQSYGFAAYTKGAIVLGQLRYIMGMENFSSGLKKYFNQWKFKHPDMNDFIRVMEKESGLELHWYFEYMINTTHTIDYSVEGIAEEDGKTIVTLRKNGVMPMPIDLTITKTDGTKIQYYAPLSIMRGEKPGDNQLILGADWPWTHPEYQLQLDIPASDIQKIEIDEAGLMADINRANNVWNR